jgi:hypothetical protein
MPVISWRPPIFFFPHTTNSIHFRNVGNSGSSPFCNLTDGEFKTDRR